MQTNNQESRRIILRDESRRNWLKRADENRIPSIQGYRQQALSQWISRLGLPKSPAHFNLVTSLWVAVPQVCLIGLKITEPYWVPYSSALGLVLTIAILIAICASAWIAQMDKSLRFSLCFFWGLIAVGIAMGGILTL